jgi:hypothetical protein
MISFNNGREGGREGKRKRRTAGNRISVYFHKEGAILSYSLKHS